MNSRGVAVGAAGATVLEILAEGLQLLRQYATTFAGIGAITFLPSFALDLAAPLLREDPVLVPLSALARLVFIAIQVLGITTIPMVVAQVLAGEVPSAREAFRTAVDAFGRTAWTMLVLVLPVGLVLGLVAAGLAGAVVAVPVLVYVHVSLTVLFQVVLFERRSGKDAVHRCWALIDGHRMRALGVLLGAYAGIGLVAASAVLAAQLELGALVEATSALIFLALALSYIHVLSTLLYFDIRANGEGMALVDLRSAISPVVPVEVGGGGLAPVVPSCSDLAATRSC